MQRIDQQPGHLYSPRQVFWATFLGGPLALTYLLSRNSEGLKRRREARRFFAIGIMASFVVLLLLMVLPGRLSTGVFIACAFGGQQMTRERHFDGAKTPPEDARIYSSWWAFGSAVAALLIWLVLAVLAATSLEAAGIKVPD